MGHRPPSSASHVVSANRTIRDHEQELRAFRQAQTAALRMAHHELPNELACQRAVLGGEIEWSEYERRIDRLVRDAPGSLLTESERRKGVRYVMGAPRGSGGRTRALVARCAGLAVGAAAICGGFVCQEPVLVVVGALFVGGFPF